MELGQKKWFCYPVQTSEIWDGERVWERTMILKPSWQLAPVTSGRLQSRSGWADAGLITSYTLAKYTCLLVQLGLPNDQGKILSAL